MDVTALQSLKNTYERSKKRGITMLLSHVQQQPMSVMEKAGFVEEVGEENFCANIDEALERAKMIKRSLSKQNVQQ